MDFALSDEQLLIRDSINRLMSDRYRFEARKRYQNEAAGWSRVMWREYASLGLLGLPFAEGDGGLGCGAVETMLVQEALGGALALEPYFATITLAGGILRRAAAKSQRRALFPDVIMGRLILAFAHTEPDARYNLSSVTTSARRDGDRWILNGRKTLVLHGDSADKLIVSARTDGDRDSEQGLALFVVDAHAAGLSRQVYVLQDGQRAAHVVLDGVSVSADAAIGEPGRVFPLIVLVIDKAIAAQCAEAVGAMTALHGLTVEYLKQRQQFGVAIGSFQALQHRAVDMLIALEQARSMALFATMMSESNNRLERSKAMSAAKIQIGRSARFIGEQAIQLHGGIGMSMEYAGGHYLKRLTMLDIMYGDSDYHLRRLAEMGGLFSAT